MQLEIDDHGIGTMPAVETIAGDEIARLDDGLDAGVLQDAPAALQHDRVVVDDEDAGHRDVRQSAPRPASASGMTIRTRVPPPGAGSTAHSPPSACTRS